MCHTRAISVAGMPCAAKRDKYYYSYFPARQAATALVNSTNCATPNCSGRRVIMSASEGGGDGNKARSELRNVLRRCPKAVFTTVLNRASSHPSDV